MTLDFSNKPGEEVKPPWIKYPGYSPGDSFWRQTGEAWLSLIWRPYWDSLGSEEQDAYLKRWKVPQEWSLYYFNRNFVKWLEEIDDE
jgi:hypothetical protein